MILWGVTGDKFISLGPHPRVSLKEHLVQARTAP